MWIRQLLDGPTSPATTVPRGKCWAWVYIVDGRVAAICYDQWY
jgi:hypothetical protein